MTKRRHSNLALLALAAAALAPALGIMPPPEPLGAQTLHSLETTTPLAASATFTGTSRDAGDTSITPWNSFSCFIVADQAGTARLEKSSTGTSGWVTGIVQPVVASTPLRLTDRADSRFARCVVINGATAQAALTVRSSYGK